MAQNTTETQAATGFIDDGYNVRRHIRGVARLYPAVDLEVRVMLPADRAAWQYALSRLAEDERPRFNAETVAARLVRWSLPKPITPDNLLRLVPSLWDRVFDLVLGESAGDPLPETGKVPENDPEADAKN